MHQVFKCCQIYPAGMVYFIPKLTILPITKLWIKKVSGLGNIPKKCPFIVAANHASYMDHLIITSTLVMHLDKNIYHLAKKEHFDNFFKKAWHTYSGCIPVDRELGGEDALQLAIDALNNGKIIVIHPEGTRTLTGRLQKAKTGVARIALLSKAPVIPIGLIGTFEILPKGKYIPSFRRAIMNIGKPMHFEEYYKRKVNKRLLRKVTTKIMKEIAALCGQEYNF